ncbi:MAG TPA: leucyl aminopeptidase [Caulobacteraceae bacterium]|nr:leucyl aminopeptidase [Caulobacteraceae bacterium]
MQIDFVAASPQAAETTALAVLAFEDGEFSPAAEALDKQIGGAIRRAIGVSKFKGQMGQSLAILAPAGVKAGRVLVVGAGKQAAFDPKAAETAGAHAFNAAKDSGSDKLLLMMPPAGPERQAHAAFGIALASYRWDRHRPNEKPEKKPTVKAVDIACADPKAAAKTFRPLSTLAEAICYARDLVSEPANVLHPEEYARRVRELTRLGLEVEVLGEKEMKKLGMGALLGVGQGSVRESQLVVIQWKGAKDPKAAPIAFVGKGVCFDSGGISIKPAEGMEEMITDMGGSAAVAGAMYSLAARKAKVNAVGVLGLVENMPDGAAQRPGDVVTTMSGQTVEVINTDAEGRLVLADAVWYCQDRFKPKFVIDLATLTGAIVVALGKDLAGLYCTDETLAENLLAASKASDEALWRMPLPSQYEKHLETPAADMRNTGPRQGGSITAALFIKKFTNGLPWAHLDIASTAWKPSSSVPTIPSGATGFGVRLLDRLSADFYEG